MKVTTFYRPSQKMEEKFGEDDAPKYAQDFTVVERNRKKGLVAACLGDWANNFKGESEYAHNPTRERRGLRPGVQLNGGVIGAETAKIAIEKQPFLTGSKLVDVISEALRSQYSWLNIIKFSRGKEEAALQEMRKRRTELFTGYVGHALVEEGGDKPKITLTGVGDVYIAVDGELQLGTEKRVDLLKNEVVDEVLARLQSDMPDLTRQDVWSSLAVMMTAKQFDYQNADPAEHPLAYYAIDGTPDVLPGVTTKEIVPATRNPVITLFTDGLEPTNPDDVRLSTLRHVGDRLFTEASAGEIELDGSADYTVIEKVEL